MPQAAVSPTTSRRAVLAAGGTSFAGTFAALAALPDDRDAELLAMIARFDALERRHQALLDGLDLAAEELAEPELDAIDAEQTRLYPLIAAVPTHTLAGLRARAASLLLWAPDLLTPPATKGWDDHLMAAILRALVAPPA